MHLRCIGTTLCFSTIFYKGKQHLTSCLLSRTANSSLLEYPIREFRQNGNGICFPWKSSYSPWLQILSKFCEFFLKDLLRLSLEVPREELSNGHNFDKLEKLQQNYHNNLLMQLYGWLVGIVEWRCMFFQGINCQYKKKVTVKLFKVNMLIRLWYWHI